MALHRCVSLLTVMIILLSKGCDSQSIDCDRITINQAGNPGRWPWQVFIHIRNSYPVEGSLITHQWVLALARTVKYYSPSDIMVFLHSNEPLSNPHVLLPLESLTCDPGNKLCLLKLASPLNLTDQVQPICLASGSSTFYAGTESWITTFSAVGTNLEIVGQKECQCYNGPLSEDTICAGLKDRGSRCLGNGGAALMNKNDSVWVQSGVLSGYEGCSVPTKAGVFVRVSEYENWIRETVTGTPPGFVTVTSPGTDNDLDFNCFTGTTTDPTFDPTPDPTADLIFDPTADPPFDPTTEPTTEPTADPPFDPTTHPTTETTAETTAITPKCGSACVVVKA